jgi:hypothetical protein
MERRSLDGLRVFFAWTSFALLSVAIFSYPVRLTLDYHPIQSVVVLPRLPFFAALFYAWSAVLLILLAETPEKNPWAMVSSLIILTLVSPGLWIAASQGHIREAPLYAAQIDALKEQHHIISQSANFAYFQWPAAFLQVAMLSNATGLSTWRSVVGTQFAWNAVFAVFLYLFLLEVTGKRYLACVGVLLVLYGSVQTYKLLQQFHPGTLGMVLFLVASTLLLRTMRRSRPDGADKFLLNLVFISMVATHFVTSVAFFLVITALNILRRVRQSKLAELETALVSIALIVAWLMYLAGIASAGLARGVRDAVTQIFSGAILPGRYFHSMGLAYFGSDVPWWARVVRYIWFGGIFGLGGALAVSYAARLKRLNEIRLATFSLAAGAGAVGIVAYVLTRGEDTTRLLTYAPFPLVAILLDFFAGIRTRVRAFVGGGALVLILALSYPSFLVNNNTVNLNSLSRKAEERAGVFLGQMFGKGETLQVNSSPYPWVYYVPYASFRFPHPYFVGFSTDRFLESLQAEARAFSLEDTAQDKIHVWINTRRDVLDMRYLLGVDLPRTEGWQGVIGTLSLSTRLYDNGDVQLNARR